MIASNKKFLWQTFPKAVPFVPVPAFVPRPDMADLRLSISTAMHTVKYCAVPRFYAGATIFLWHATILCQVHDSGTPFFALF